ncbi:MAG: carbohydrate ABC transporter permease [Bacilli bacterium]
MAINHPSLSRNLNGKKRSARKWLSGHQALRLALLLPSLCAILLFSYYPAVRSIIGSFTSWNGFTSPQFIGVQNFINYVESYSFGSEIKNIAILVVGGVSISLLFPFLGASLTLSLPWRWSQSTLKYLLVVPMVIPQVILINIWVYMLNPNNGVVDAFLGLFHAPAVQWYNNPSTALFSILLIGFPWVSSLGYLIFLAGLQSISTEVKDAALMDGSSGFHRIIHVDVPLIMPQIQFVVVLSGISIVQNFIPILLVTNGGPGNATMVPGLDMYQQAFQNAQLGYGMAIGTILFIGMMIVTGVALRLLRSRT